MLIFSQQIRLKLDVILSFMSVVNTIIDLNRNFVFSLSSSLKLKYNVPSNPTDKVSQMAINNKQQPLEHVVSCCGVPMYSIFSVCFFFIRSGVTNN